MALRRIRIFVDTLLQCDEPAVLSAQASQHISKVLRMRRGDTLLAFNGSGGCYRAEITVLDKRGVEIRPLAYLDEERESSLGITLVQGISRGRHMDYTVQKAVELGVSRIVPLLTEFSNVQLDGERAQNRLGHWRTIIINACEQCGRNRLPRIEAPMRLQEWLARDEPGLKLLLEPAAGESLSQITITGTELALLSGPEGGLSEAEVNQAVLSGYLPVHLGPRILRTETAAIAALSACQTLWGDMA